MGINGIDGASASLPPLPINAASTAVQKAGNADRQRDALGALRWLLLGGPIAFSDGRERRLADVAAVHASPPCQAFSSISRVFGVQHLHPDLVAPTRELLRAAGRPWVMENVPRSPLANPVRIRGDLFGLGVIRERWFETSFPVDQPAFPHPAHGIGGGCSGALQLRLVERHASEHLLDIERLVAELDGPLHGAVGSLPGGAQYIGEQIGQSLAAIPADDAHPQRAAEQNGQPKIRCGDNFHDAGPSLAPNKPNSVFYQWQESAIPDEK